MRRGNAGSVKRIAQLEKQLGSKGDGSDLFQRAMAEVLHEATDEELKVAAGSRKRKEETNPEAMADMHEVFTARAEKKINQYKNEKRKNL
jgi:hypothetical protein